VKKTISLSVVILVIIVGVSFLMRLLPHPANFIPIGALALICGTYIRSKWAILIPVGIMAISDFIVGWHSLVFFTWGSFLLIGMIGWWVRKKKNVLRVAGGTLAGSILFFIVTNFAVWAFTPLYSKTVAGLVQCYYMAVPFFRNTALGDLFYVAIFFGLYELAYYAVVKKQIFKRSAQLDSKI